MKPANFAPIYIGIYPELAELTRKHGYALAAHGSLARDFDLICVPWIENPSDPEIVVKEITKTFALKEIGEPTIKFHNRKVYTLSISYGECFIDLSFMPLQINLEKVEK